MQIRCNLNGFNEHVIRLTVRLMGGGEEGGGGVSSLSSQFPRGKTAKNAQNPKKMLATLYSALLMLVHKNGQHNQCEKQLTLWRGGEHWKDSCKRLVGWCMKLPLTNTFHRRSLYHKPSYMYGALTNTALSTLLCTSPF